MIGHPVLFLFHPTFVPSNPPRLGPSTPESAGQLPSPKQLGRVGSNKLRRNRLEGRTRRTPTKLSQAPFPHRPPIPPHILRQVFLRTRPGFDFQFRRKVSAKLFFFFSLSLFCFFRCLSNGRKGRAALFQRMGDSSPALNGGSKKTP